MMKSLPFALCVLLTSGAACAQGAHEHGVASLQVAVDGPLLALELHSPLDNLLGFEHAPRTAAQRQAVADADVRLRDVARNFVLPEAAGCTARSLELAWPWNEGAAGHGHAHDKDAAHHHGEHADLVLRHEWTCTTPAALSALRVGLFEAFPRLQRLRAETASPRGQGAVTLTARDTTLPL